MYYIVLALATILSTSCSLKNNSANQEKINHLILGKVIYGEDNRSNIYDTEDQKLIKLSKSIAVMTYNYKLRKNRDDSNYYKYSKTPAFVSYDICDDEPFAKEFILGNCTGFLIAKDTLITAGHCLSTQETCTNTSWVFDQVTSNGLVKKSNTFKCKKIIQTGVNVSKANHFYQDYTVLELEEKPSEANRPYLELSEEALHLGDSLYTIGSPFGTPLKFADDGYITSLTSLESSIIEYARQAGDEDRHYPLKVDEYFMTNLDTFSGNSGSPIFSSRSGKVVGLLSSGSIDWDFDDINYCQRSKIKPMDEFGEESVFKTTSIKNIKELIK